MLLRLLCLLFCAKFSTSIEFKDNYTVDIEAAFLCPDNDQLEVPMRLFRVERYNRTHRAMSLNFTYLHPLDDTAEGTYLVERWTNGGWKQLPIWQWMKDPCNADLEQRRGMHIRFAKAMGLEHPDRCPIPAGNYSVVRHPYKLKYDYPFWPGRYRTASVSRRIATKQKIFCAMTILNVT